MARKKKNDKQDEQDQAIQELEDIGPQYELDEAGRFYALLPCGKKPEIVAVPTAVIRRIFDTYPEPEIPMEDVPIEGTTIAQRFEDKQDPEYLEQVQEWYVELSLATLHRFILDALVVPEDDEWAWKLVGTGVPVPEDGRDRQQAYVEEELPELLNPYNMADKDAFIAAVMQISRPSEIGVEAARRRFRQQVERAITDGVEDAKGGVSVEP